MSSAKPPLLATLFYRNAHLMVLTILVLVAAGLSAFTQLPRIEDPRITQRNPVVLTFLPGASAERVEALVTEKLEDALKEIHEIKRIDSSSRAGISSLSIELEDWVTTAENQSIFSRIRDKLSDAAKDLPSGSSAPVFEDKRGATAYTLIAAVGWPDDGPVDVGILNRHARELEDRLRRVGGTELVRRFGEPEEEITVTLDPVQLAALGISSGEVAGRIAAADPKSPAGVYRGTDQDLLLEVSGELKTLERIRQVPLADNGQGGVVRLGDVAEVRRGWRSPPNSIALANGKRVVLVAARVGVDVRVDRWAPKAREVVEAYAEQLRGSVSIDLRFDQSRYTNERLEGLGGSLLAGSLVVTLVVFFTMGWRAALIVGSALPLSAAGVLFGLTFFGQQIHQMSIFGMIIAIGLLIDNAIVVTDEVRKRRLEGFSPVQAVGRAVQHLFVPLLASTLTTILSFMPVFLMPGNAGDFVSPIAISVVLALLVSFPLSLTVIAALAGRYLPADQQYHWWRDGLSSRAAAKVWHHGLSGAVQRPVLTLLATLSLPVLGFVLSSSLGMQFFPPADRDQFEIEAWSPRNASVTYSVDVAEKIEAQLRQEEGVIGVDWLIGGSYPPVYYNVIEEHDREPYYAHAIVTVDGVEASDALIKKLQRQLPAQIPEAQLAISPFGQGPPYEAPVAFRIVGPDPERLRELGEQLRAVMAQHPQILSTRATIAGGDPKLWFDADEDQARLVGLSLGDMVDQFQTALEGQTGGSLLEDRDELPVRLRFDDQQRSSLERMASLNLVTPTAGWLPAEALGEMRLRPERGEISRRNGERVNKILGYITADALPIEVTKAVLQSAAEQGVEMPPGYRLEISGDSEEQGRAVSQLMTYLPVLVLLMVASLVLSFRSASLAGLLGIVAMMSAGLGMLALWIAGYPIGFNPLLGTVGLIGVAINDSIVVLAAIHANPLARRGDVQAIVNETIACSRHVISTTLTTIGGFIPLFISGGTFWPPLAVVIAGGVAFATVVALLFVPAAYRLLAMTGLFRRNEPEPSQVDQAMEAV